MKEATQTTQTGKGFGTSRLNAVLDRMGASASFICAIHCAAMPLIITLLPFVGLSFLADQRLEWLLVGLSAIMGVSSLCLGYREHGQRWIFAVLSVGLTMLTLGRILEARSIGGMWAIAIVVLGGMTIALSHVLNRRLCNTCHTCTHSH